MERTWGTLMQVWVPQGIRDQVVDVVREWSGKSGVAAGCFVGWLGLSEVA